MVICVWLLQLVLKSDTCHFHSHVTGQSKAHGGLRTCYVSEFHCKGLYNSAEKGTTGSAMDRIVSPKNLYVEANPKC